MKINSCHCTSPLLVELILSKTIFKTYRLWSTSYQVLLDPSSVLGEKLLPFACFHPDWSFPGTPCTPCVTRDGKYLLCIHLSNYQAHHLPVLPHAVIMHSSLILASKWPLCLQGHAHPPATLLFQCSSYPGVSQELESSGIWSERTNT